MNRPEFFRLLGGAATWPLAARAQQAGRIARVGVLGPDLNNSVSGPGYQVFFSELRKLGFTEGQNLVVEYRRTDEGMPKAFTGANEMVAAKADVLVANGLKFRCRRRMQRDPRCRSSCWRIITTRSRAVTSKALRAEHVSVQADTKDTTRYWTSILSRCHCPASASQRLRASCRCTAPTSGCLMSLMGPISEVGARLRDVSSRRRRLAGDFGDALPRAFVRSAVSCRFF
jgi:hypothetical protein